MKTILLVCAVLGCGSSSGPMQNPDAAKPEPDAATHDAAASADARVAALTHVLYLNFEGASVVPAAVDDSATGASNQATTAATLSPFLAADADRQTKIAALVADLDSALAPYDITVVTTRPASEPYVMEIATDDASPKIGVTGAPRLVPDTCNTVAASIDFEFGGDGSDLAPRFTRDAMSMFAYLAGIPPSQKIGDCMCFASPNCDEIATACTIGGANTPIIGGGACGESGTMDEGAKFIAAFGPHP